MTVCLSSLRAVSMLGRTFVFITHETHEKLPTTGQMCKCTAAGCRRQIKQLDAAALTMSTE